MGIFLLQHFPQINIYIIDNAPFKNVATYLFFFFLHVINRYSTKNNDRTCIIELNIRRGAMEGGGDKK